MKNIDIINAFLDHRMTQYGHLSTDGTCLYSYWTCIAEFVKNDITEELTLIINKTYYSNTTSHHREMLIREAKSQGYRIRYVVDIPKGTDSLLKCRTYAE